MRIPFSIGPQGSKPFDIVGFGLNSVDFEDLWYYGHIDSSQLEWLKKDLAPLDTSTTIVTFQHIPFYSGG